MTDGEMRLQGQEIVNMIRNLEISDNEILGQIKEKSYLVEIKLMSGRNLFMEAVDNGRIDLTKALKELGSDINLRCIGSGTCGNAMNLAKTKEMVEYLLEIGVEVIPFIQLCLLQAGIKLRWLTIGEKKKNQDLLPQGLYMI